MAAQPGHLTWMKYVFSCPKSTEYRYQDLGLLLKSEGRELDLLVKMEHNKEVLMTAKPGCSSST